MSVEAKSLDNNGLARTSAELAAYRMCLTSFTRSSVFLHPTVTNMF